MSWCRRGPWMRRGGKRCGVGALQSLTAPPPRYCTFADVPPGVLDGGVAVDVGEQAEAKSVAVIGGIREAVDEHAGGGRLERLSHPIVELVPSSRLTAGLVKEKSEVTFMSDEPPSSPLLSVQKKWEQR
ncbi:hypothetical protein EYF80_000116 [Liparis tanakae]|uniref:Uncharacterized protein n=1 Tax=Liparis tanakae TaxID=230148 RepID=A0A4Z2JI75_9TELE|nr:hypothetical protein EYF80_000116 [Liparis tanakae]